jgi:hypothetical protein
MRPLGADVLGAERAAQEVVHRLRLADRGGRAVRAADRVLERHVAAVPRLAVIGLGLAHEFVRDPGGMREPEALGAEALGLGGLHPGGTQAIRPVADRVRGHGDADGPELVGPAPAHPSRLAVGEAREDRREVADPVGVVEVVDRDLAVEEDGLLDAAEAEQADVEVVILLRAADAERQVMGAADHRGLEHLLRYTQAHA